MCCCAEFIVKYVLFIANFVFSLVGLALIGLGIAVLVQLSEITGVVPVALNSIPIAVIVLGAIVFAIAFFGCCGAIRESRCLLTMYFICMAILAAGKIYLVTVIFGGLATIQATVVDWVETAFANEADSFRFLEVAFRCCGTTGPASYGAKPLPYSCCAEPESPTAACALDDAFETGCAGALTSYFEAFGGAIGGVLIAVIIVELVAMLFGMFMCWSVSSKRR